MINKKIILPAFILLVLVQLYVPINMIWSKEKVLRKGTAYKFQTAPIDPNDPFRGKYITLDFRGNSFTVSKYETWNSGETIFVLFSRDTAGFARISSVSKKKPSAGSDYLEALVGFASVSDSTRVFIEYPFERFYLEETKAGEAETLYQRSAVDSSQVAYALVHIWKGDAVIKDVLINGVSVTELVRSTQRNDQ